METLNKKAINFNNCKIISDPEGYDIKQLSQNNEKTIDTIIILGDLLDSTFVLPPNFDNLDNLDIQSKINNIYKPKSYNIRNLAFVNNNNNIVAALGNRDLNKLKLRKLLEFKYKTNESLFQFEIINKTFVDLVNKLIEECNKENNNYWSISSLNDKNMFSPFWKKERSEFFIKTHFNTANNNKNINHFPNKCIDRFDRIFGMDGTVGTMSAPNLLYTIPLELKELDFISFDVEKLIKLIENFKQNKLNEKNTEIIDAENKLAACVLVFFKIALINTDLNNAHLTKQNINLVSLLAKYLKSDRTFVCAYKEFDNNNRIALFSHGGITHSFLNYDYYNFKTNLIAKVWNLINKPQPKPTSGGYLGETNNIIDVNTLKKKINTFNAMYKKNIEICLTEETQSPPMTDNLLFILCTTAPVKLVPNPNLNSNSEFNSSIHSPVLPGLIIIREEQFLIQDHITYNFFGHYPSGNGPVVDKIKINEASQSFNFQKTREKFERSNNLSQTKTNITLTYNINTDISNTLFSNIPRIDIENYKDNYSYLIFNNSNNTLNNYLNIKLSNSYLSELLKTIQKTNTNNTTTTNTNTTNSNNFLISDSTYNLFELPDDILIKVSKNDNSINNYSAQGLYYFGEKNNENNEKNNENKYFLLSYLKNFNIYNLLIEYKPPLLDGGGTVFNRKKKTSKLNGGKKKLRILTKNRKFNNINKSKKRKLKLKYKKYTNKI